MPDHNVRKCIRSGARNLLVMGDDLLDHCKDGHSGHSAGVTRLSECLAESLAESHKDSIPAAL